MRDDGGTRRAKEVLISFDPDEMEGCHSCKYGENFNTEKEPCKYCYGLSMYTKKEEIQKAEKEAIDAWNTRMELKEQKCQCYTCIYAPNNECGWYAACNNCIDGSNYWRKSEDNK